MSRQFRVIARGDGWLAAEKPAGISFHSEDGSAGFVAQLEAQLQHPLWPVHRLDKVTSGILLFATRADTATILSEEFAQRRAEKFYLAMGSGKPSKKQGWIKGDMAKSRNGCYKLLRQTDNPAITRFLSHFDESSGKRLFLLSPKTGRTHQLRVAMKSLGTPILGDERYGGEKAERTYLHAWMLRITAPDGPVTLTSAPAECWPELPADWQNPFTLNL